jgi:hypothetical protein
MIHVDHSHRPGVVCSSLPTTLGARQSSPKGRLRNGLFKESACRRGVGHDIEDSRRSLPSKAHVQRSAVSVGCAAGRLTGTRGTLKARVDHSMAMSSMTSKVDVDHFHRRVEDEIERPCRALPSKAHVRRSAVSVGCAAGRLTGTRGTLKADVDHSMAMSSMTSKVHVDHSHGWVEDDIEGPRRSLPSRAHVELNHRQKHTDRLSAVGASFNALRRGSRDQ